MQTARGYLCSMERDAVRRPVHSTCCVPGFQPCQAEASPRGPALHLVVFCHYPHGGWANRLRNVPVEKLCCRPGSHWKWPRGGFLPLSPDTGPSCQTLFRATVFLAFHRLFVLAVSWTHTQYFCSSREVLPQPLQSEVCCAPIVLFLKPNIFYEYVQTAEIFWGWLLDQVFTDMSCRKWSLVSPIHSPCSKTWVWQHFFKGKVVETFSLQKSSFSCNLILVP